MVIDCHVHPVLYQSTSASHASFLRKQWDVARNSVES
jgi:hypothetical protein